MTLVAAGLLLATTTQPWVRASLPTGPGGSLPPVPVTGATAAPAVTALGLVALAGAVALSLVRGAGRVAAAGLVVLAGLGAGAAVAGLVADPSGAARAAARAATGVAEVDGATVTAWPLVALLPCLLVVACGVVAVAAGRTWATSGRFETPAARPAPTGASSRAALWDELSQGLDPTTRPGRAPGAGPRRDAAE